MSDAETRRGMHAPSGLAAARHAFLEWLRQGGSEGRAFLQIHLRRLDHDRFSARHLDDRALRAVELEQYTDPYQARDLAQTTADGAHRPLKTAPDLRRGWRFEALDERGLWTVLDYLYPACVGHWHARREGTLRVTHWAETAGRQSGMYSSVRLLPQEAVRDTVRACCGDAVCLRRVAWGPGAEDPMPFIENSLDEAASREGNGDSTVPCPEACSIFISFARAVLAIERAPRRTVGGLGSLNDLEIEQIRALVAAAAGGKLQPPREGEFDQPLNRRRLRYLSIRLAQAEAQRTAGEERAPE